MNKTVSIRSTESCHLIKAAGFHGVDYDFTCIPAELEDENFEKNARSDLERIAAEGLCLSQVHLSYHAFVFPPIGDGSYDAYEAKFLPILTKEIKLAAEMGCKLAVNHMYYEDDAEITKESNVRLINKLLPTLEKCGVTLAIENIYDKGATDAHFTTADDLMYYTDLFKSKYVGICLDTGHAAVLNQKPLDMLRTLGERVKAVHLHAGVPNFDLHSFPYIMGAGYWPELVDLLGKLEACENLNFEIRPQAPISERTAKAFYEFLSALADDIVNFKKT